jgi:hypothetical protein
VLWLLDSAVLLRRADSIFLELSHIVSLATAVRKVS